MDSSSPHSFRPWQAPRSSNINKNPAGKLFAKRTVDKALPSVPAPHTQVSNPRPPTRTLRTTSPSMSDSGPVFPTNWRGSGSSNDTVFEEDFIESSDSDSAIVPLRISNSVKELLKKSSLQHSSLHLLALPSSEENVHRDGTNSAALNVLVPTTVPAKLLLSPAALAALGGGKTTLHSRAASSLDGSLTSDEAASLSCPSTPNHEYREASDCEWEVPVLLRANTIESPRHLSPEVEDLELQQVIELSKLHTTEMRECGLNIDMVGLFEDGKHDDQESLSAISIPSPEGFFASLGTPSRDLWGFPSEDITPSTGTAERFYGVPWARPAGDVVQHVFELQEDGDTDGPPTARQEMFTRRRSNDISKEVLNAKDEVYEEMYQQKLVQTANSHLSRTDVWITAQESYLAALRLAPNEPHQLLLRTTKPATNRTSLLIEIPSPPKKYVRFAGLPSTPVTAIPAGLSISNDKLFLQAFQESMKEARKQDVIVHAIARADAIQMQRLYLSDLHHSQLAGNYKLRKSEEVPQLRIDFPHIASAPSQSTIRQFRDSIILADKERQAVHQTALARWNITAIRCLNGGRLLPVQAHNLITTSVHAGGKPRILDLGGIPIADWAWAAALEYPEATIYTAVLASESPEWEAHTRPSNHRVVTCSNLWTLPFSSDTFDVVSARTLHMALRNMPPDSSLTDEYQLTLGDLHRVLRPNGVLHFSSLDAEISAVPGSSVSSKSTHVIAPLATISNDFISTLRTAGYDPCPSTTLVNKLRATGFRSITKANLCLRAGFHHPPNPMREDCPEIAQSTCPIPTSTVPKVSPSTPPPMLGKKPSSSVLKRDPTTPTTPKTSNTLVQKMSSPALRRVFAGNGGSSKPTTPSKSPLTPERNAPDTPSRKLAYPTLDLLAAAKKPFSSSVSITTPVAAKLSDTIPLTAFSPAPAITSNHAPPLRAPPPRPPLPPATFPDLPNITTLSSSSSSTISTTPESDSIAALASMVGSIAWERWMLKLQVEQGREQTKLLEGVAEALEAVGREGREGGAVGWRMCVGCARKA